MPSSGRTGSNPYRRWRALRAALLGALCLVGSLRAQGAGSVAGPTAPLATLTDEERAFLAGRTLRVGVDSARAPFEFVDAEGAYAGISASYIQACASRLGVKLVVVPGLPVAQAIEKVKAGEVDVVPKVTPTPDRERHLRFTVPYVTFPSVMVTRKDARFIGGFEDLVGLRVGVLKGLVVEELLKKDHPEIPLVLLPNIREALLQLSTGKVDVFIDNLGTVSYTIDQLGLTNLKVAAPTPYVHDLAFGVRRDMPLLQSALDKALASLGSQERSQIKSRWLGGASEVRGLDWKVAGPLVALAALLAGAVLLWNRHLRRTIRARERIQAELAAHAEAIERQAQIKAQVSLIATELQEAPTFEALAERFLGLVVPLLGAVHGAFHGLAEGRLRYLGGYARTLEEERPPDLALGEGLVGQCAQQQAPIHLQDPAGIPLRIPTGREPLVPRELLILPVVRREVVLGVLSLASLGTIGEAHRALLDELLPILALNLEVQAGNQEARRLLAQARRHAEDLAEAEQKSRTILDSISVGTLLIDPEARTVVDANPVAARMLGRDREALLGQPCHALGCPGSAGDCTLLDHGQAQANADGVLRTADGRELPVLKTIVAVTLGGQRLLLESFVDITEQKRLDAELRQHTEELERFSRLTVDREARMIELKQEINALRAELGRPQRYVIVE